MKTMQKIALAVGLAMTMTGAAQATAVSNYWNFDGTKSYGTKDDSVATTNHSGWTSDDESNWANSNLGGGYEGTQYSGTGVLKATYALTVSLTNQLVGIGAYGVPIFSVVPTNSYTLNPSAYTIDLTGCGDTSTIDYILVNKGSNYLLLDNHNPDSNGNKHDWATFAWSGSTSGILSSLLGGIAYDLNGSGSDSGQTDVDHFSIFRKKPPTAPAVSVPEPASLGLMGMGLLAAGLRRRRKAV